MEHAEPEVVPVTLNKPLNSGMGISIVAAKVSASNVPGAGILQYLQILIIETTKQLYL